MGIGAVGIPNLLVDRAADRNVVRRFPGSLRDDLLFIDGGHAIAPSSTGQAVEVRFVRTDTGPWILDESSIVPARFRDSGGRLLVEALGLAVAHRHGCVGCRFSVRSGTADSSAFDAEEEVHIWGLRAGEFCVERVTALPDAKLARARTAKWYACPSHAPIAYTSSPFRI